MTGEPVSLQCGKCGATWTGRGVGDLPCPRCYPHLWPMKEIMGHKPSPKAEEQ